MAEKEKSTLGRLSVFAIQKPWQACLLAPRRYLALDDVISDTPTLLNGTSISDIPAEGLERQAVIVGHVANAAQYDPIKKRCNMTLELRDGTQCRVMAFGHPDQQDGNWRRQGSHVALLGKVLVKNDGFTLMFAPQSVPHAFVGRAIGVYPGKTRTIKPETTRQRVLAHITDAHISDAIDAIKTSLQPYSLDDVLAQWGRARGFSGMCEASFPRAIRCLHHPRTPAQGELSQSLLLDLSALAMLLQAERERPRQGSPRTISVAPDTLEHRIQSMSHTPTREQRQAVSDMLDDMGSGKPSHRLLSGDVGTGKTTVFALLAAVMHDAGERVAILLPSEDMVSQVRSEMHRWWPDLEMDTVTGSTPKDADLTAPVRLGTTAVIHRQARDNWAPTLTIVDEQQKYSADQRHTLVEQGGHLLECTATCLPRTMAQIQFGLVPVSRLTEPHTPKDIASARWDTQDRPAMHGLFADIKETLAGGDQVLVIFAARDAKYAATLSREDQAAEEGPSAGQGTLIDNKPAALPPVLSLEEGIDRWRRVLSEDQVVGLHGKMKAADRKKSLAALHEGRASVLCATSAAEVGLNLPRLRHVVIHNPERFGLVTLHQIRGRVARTGGWGRCDLLANAAHLSDSAADRLAAFTGTQDGFALADQDMRQRGIGSLLVQASRQSGQADIGLLFGERPDMEHFERAQAMLADLSATPLEHPETYPQKGPTYDCSLSDVSITPAADTPSL